MIDRRGLIALTARVFARGAIYTAGAFARGSESGCSGTVYLTTPSFGFLVIRRKSGLDTAYFVFAIADATERELIEFERALIREGEGMKHLLLSYHTTREGFRDAHQASDSAICRCLDRSIGLLVEESPCRPDRETIASLVALRSASLVKGRHTQ